MKRIFCALLAGALTLGAALPVQAADKAVLRVEADAKQTAISDHLYGAFIEDISYACDGGLVSNLVNNDSFEYASAPTTGWVADGLELTTEGAELIARLADGAMRDALSILDTCAGVTAKVDADVVRRMAGVTDRSYLFRISDAIAAQDAPTALAQLAQLRQQSVDVKRLTEELIAHYRALMLAALPGGQTLLSGVSPEEEAQYLEKGPRLGQREAIRAIRTLGTALEHMTRGSDQRIELELALVNLAEPLLSKRYKASAFDAARKFVQDPNGKWMEYAYRAINEIDPHILKMNVLNLGYEGMFSGYNYVMELRKKYDCNMPWILLFDPTASCNLHCKGCWAAEYGKTLNLTYEEMEKSLGFTGICVPAVNRCAVKTTC